MCKLILVLAKEQGGLQFLIPMSDRFDYYLLDLNRKWKEISLIKRVDQISLDYFAPGYAYSPMTLSADVASLSFPDEFADGMIILHVLEHIPEIRSAVKHLSRVLRRETGWALIEVPCETTLSQTVDCRFKSRKERIDCAGQHDHVWRFNCSDFKEILQEFLTCSHAETHLDTIGNVTLSRMKINAQNEAVHTPNVRVQEEITSLNALP